MPRLVSPSISYKQSFLEACQEFHREDMWEELDYSFLLYRFEDYVKELQDQEKGRGLPLGWVPSSTYWIIDNNDVFSGVINLRHRLTDSLKKFGGHVGYEIRPSKRKFGLGSWALKELIPLARKRGLKKLLVTCDDNNIASRKIIEKNGGVFDSEIQNEGHERPTLRFWISI